MDVKCEQCGTLYVFEDNRVTAAGVKVKCTQCGHEFVVSAGGPAAASPVQAEAQWQVRTVGGSVFSFRDLTTLQRWIVERKVGRDDQISRSGDVWRRLGDIVELQAFFAAVDGSTGALQAMASPAAPPPAEPAAVPPPAVMPPTAVPPPAAIPPPAAPPEPVAPTTDALPRTAAFEAEQQQIPAPAGPAVHEAPAPEPKPSPAPEPQSAPAVKSKPEPTALDDPREGTNTGEWMAKDPAAEEYDDFADLHEGEQPIGKGKIIAGVVIGLVCLIALGFVFMPKTMKALFGLGGPSSGAAAKFNEGLASLYTDTDDGFETARRAMEAAHKEDELWAGALAGMTLVGAAEAEQVNDIAAPIRQEIDFLKGEMAALLPDQDEEKKKLAQQYNFFVGKYKKFQDQIRELQSKAWKDVEAAQKLDPEGIWVRIALADFYRVFGGDQRRRDVADLLTAVSKAAPGNPWVLFERGAFRVTDPQQRVNGFKDLAAVCVKEPRFVRALYRAGLARAAAGDLAGGRVTLQQVLELQPKHRSAKAFLKRTEAGGDAAAKLVTANAPDKSKPPDTPPGVPVEPEKTDALPAPPLKPVPPVAKVVKPAKKPPRKPVKPPSATGGKSKSGGKYARMLAQGHRLRARGKYDKALEAFEKAADMQPDSPEPHAGMGWAYIDLEAFRAAVNEFRKALKANPKHSDAVLGTAEAYKFQGDKKKAIRYYERYLQLSPRGEGAAIAKKYIEQNK